jgi:hypothetical protein
MGRFKTDLDITNAYQLRIFCSQLAQDVTKNPCPLLESRDK